MCVCMWSSGLVVSVSALWVETTGEEESPSVAARANTPTNPEIKSHLFSSEILRQLSKSSHNLPPAVVPLCLSLIEQVREHILDLCGVYVCWGGEGDVGTSHETLQTRPCSLQFGSLRPVLVAALGLTHLIFKLRRRE